MRYCPCFYCRYFMNPITNRHQFYYPLERLFHKIWFAIPSFIFNKNCKLRDELGLVYQGKVVPLIPFYGLIVEIEEGATPTLSWWKSIKFVGLDNLSKLK